MFSGIRDVCQIPIATNSSFERLAGVREVGSNLCFLVGALLHRDARARAADSINARVRLAAQNDRLHEECALLREELRIKYARTAQNAPQRRPHYESLECMAILELRAVRGWSLKQTADTFFLTSATIASWVKRIDQKGPNALLQLREPVNKFPEFVRYIVQQLKILSPCMGKVKIAETLCRAGLHLGVTTVGRILKEEPQSDPGETVPCTRVVTAQRPNHAWHVDLTAVPTSVGFWVPWLPFALPRCWPFSWWVAVIIDHYSRHVMYFAIFRNNPTSKLVQRFLESAIETSTTPFITIVKTSHACFFYFLKYDCFYPKIEHFLRGQIRLFARARRR